MFSGNEPRVCTYGRREIGQSSREPTVSEIPSNFFGMATVLPSADLIGKKVSSKHDFQPYIYLSAWSPRFKLLRKTYGPMIDNV